MIEIILLLPISIKSSYFFDWKFFEQITQKKSGAYS